MHTIFVQNISLVQLDCLAGEKCTVRYRTPSGYVYLSHSFCTGGNSNILCIWSVSKCRRTSTNYKKSSNVTRGSCPRWLGNLRTSFNRAWPVGSTTLLTARRPPPPSHFALMDLACFYHTISMSRQHLLSILVDGSGGIAVERGAQWC